MGEINNMWQKFLNYFGLNKFVVEKMKKQEFEILYCKNGEKTRSYPSQMCLYCGLDGFIVELEDIETSRICNSEDKLITRKVSSPYCVIANFCPQCGKKIS
jgi:hypothetical protein